jgi:hypothetical protein
VSAEASSSAPASPAAASDVTRGLSPDLLAQPAGEVMARVPWEGAAPDPDSTDAATFLAWL